VSLKKDFNGTSIPFSKSPDIGTFEFSHAPTINSPMNFRIVQIQ